MRTIQLCTWSKDNNRYDVYTKLKEGTTWCESLWNLSFSEIQIAEEIATNNTFQTALLYAKHPTTSIQIIALWKLKFKCELEWIDRDYQELLI